MYLTGVCLKLTLYDQTTWVEKMQDGGEGMFVSKAGNGVDEKLAEATVGLVSAADFKRKREELEAASEAAEAAKFQALADEERRAIEKEERRKKKTKKAAEQKRRSSLSFDCGDEEEEQE